MPEEDLFEEFDVEDRPEHLAGRILNAETLEEVNRLGHMVESVSFSPDGNLLLYVQDIAILQEDRGYAISLSLPMGDSWRQRPMAMTATRAWSCWTCRRWNQSLWRRELPAGFLKTIA